MSSNVEEDLNSFSSSSFDDFGGEADNGHDSHQRNNSNNGYGWRNVQHLLEDNNGSRHSNQYSNNITNARWSGAVQEQRRSSSRAGAYTRQDSESSGSLQNDLMVIPSMIAPPSWGSEGKRSKHHSKFDHPVARQRKLLSVKRKDSESSDDYLLSGGRPTKSIRENDLMAIPSLIAPPKTTPRRRSDIPQQRPVPKPSPLPKHPGRRARSFVSPRDRRMSAGKYKRTQQQHNYTAAASPRRNSQQRQQKINHLSADTMASTASSHKESQHQITSPQHLTRVNFGTPVKTPQYTASINLEYKAVDEASLEDMGDNHSEIFPPLSPDKSLFSHASEASGSPPKSIFSYWLSPPSTKNRKYSSSDEDTFDGLSTMYSSMVPSDSSSPAARRVQTINTSDDEFHPLPFDDRMNSPDKKWPNSVDLVNRCPESPMTPHDQLLFGHLHNGYPERNVTPSRTLDYDNEFPDLAQRSTIGQDEIETEVPRFESAEHDMQPKISVERNKKPVTIKKTKLKSATSRQHPRRKWDFADLDTVSSDSVDDSFTMTSSSRQGSPVESSSKPGKRRWKFEELLESQGDDDDDDDDDDDATDINSAELNDNSLLTSSVESDRQQSLSRQENISVDDTPGKRKWKFEELLASPDALTASSVESDQKERLSRKDSLSGDDTPGKRKWKFEELLASPDDGLSSPASITDQLNESHDASESDGSVRTEDGSKQICENNLTAPGKRKWKFEELLTSDDDADNSESSASIRLRDSCAEQVFTDTHCKTDNWENSNYTPTPGKRKWKFEELLASSDEGESPHFVRMIDEPVQSDSDDSILNIVLDKQDNKMSPNVVSGKRRWKFEDLLASNDDEGECSSARLSLTSIGSRSDYHDEEVADIQSQSADIDENQLHDIITIFQSRVRGAIVRKSYHQCHDAALTIQKFVRYHNFNRVRQWEEAIVKGLNDYPATEAKIQKHILACNENVQFSLQQRQNYLDYHSSILGMLDSRISNIKTLRRYEQYHRFLSSVVQMQANIRARQSRKPLVSMENKSSRSMDDFEADNAVSDQIKRYSQAHAALVSLQALFRGAICRKRLNAMQSATILLQHCTRAMLQRRRYRRLLSGLIAFQATVRGVLERKSSVILRSVVSVQSHLRSFTMRSRYIKKRTCIILIQKTFRGMQAKTLMNRLQFCATSIQSVARGFVVRCRYARIRRGVISFQALVRGHHARNVAAVTISALMNMQCHVRAFIQKKKYIQFRLAAILVQSKIRAFKQQSRYKTTAVATLCIQSFIRGSLVRKRMTSAYANAIIIQRRWAMYRDTLRTQKMRISYANDLREVYLAVTKIQSAFRMHRCKCDLLQKKEESRIAKAQRKAIASTTIQSAVRMWMCRRMALRMTNERDVAKEYDAAVAIQSIARAMLSRRELVSLKEAVAHADDCARRLTAAVVIQSFVRSVFCQRMVEDMKKRNRELIVIRSAAATTIQSKVRSLHCEKELSSRRLQASKRRNAATKLQSFWRSWSCRTELSVASRHATTIQRCYSRFRNTTGISSADRVKLVYSDDLQKTCLAATKIQSALRMHRSRYEVLQKKEKYYRIASVQNEAVAAITIQSAVRMWMCRRMALRMTNERDVAKEYDAAVVIQSIARAMLSRRELVSLKEAVAHADDCARRLAAAVVIQSFVRPVLCRRIAKKLMAENVVRRNTAIFIQSFIRGSLVRKRMTSAYANAIIIQRRWAMYRDTLRTQKMRISYANDLREVYLAVTKIQSAFRMHRCKCDLLQKKEESRIAKAQRKAIASTTIQSAVRMWMCRRMVLRMTNERDVAKEYDAAVAIQSIARAMLSRRELVSLKEAVAHADDCARRLAAAVVIQSFVRSVFCQRMVEDMKKRSREHILMRSAASTTIQSVVRMWMYRHLLSQIAKERDMTKKYDAAVVIQSIARTMLCRREMASMKVAAAKVYHEKHFSYLQSQLSPHDLAHLTRAQALLRGKLVRMKFRDACLSAVRIQKQWKCMSDLEVVTYPNYLRSVLTIQKKFKRYYSRRNFAAKKIQLSYLSRRMKRNLTKVHHSVELIQRVVRGHRARCFVQRIETFQHHDAATKIQAIARAHLRRSDLRSAVANVLKIQRCYRRFKVAFVEDAIRDEKKAYNDMLHREAMARRIQTAARSWLRQLNRSKGDMKVNAEPTTKIYSASFNTDDASARVIQVKWRSFRCCKEFLVTRAAAVVIQSFVRSWMCQRELSTLRSTAAEADLFVKEAAAVSLQSFARSIMCQKQLSKLKAEDRSAETEREETRLFAARKIQSISRTHLCRRKMQSASLNATKIQRCYRCYKSNTEWTCLDEKKAYTSMLERCHQEAMVVRIQAVARSWLCKRSIRSTCLSATIIQAKWRSHNCKGEILVRRAQSDRRELAIQSVAAVVIQSIVRSWLCRRELKMRKARLRVREAAAITIQSLTRSHNARIVQSRILSTHLMMKSKSAVLIQSIARMYLFKSRFEVASKAAYTIQHAWRQFVSCLQNKILVVSDLLTVPCRSRVPIPMHKARALLPRDLKRLNRIRSITPHLPRRYECGVFIQEVINSVAIVIQSFARRYLVLCQVKKLHKSASRVQQSWRSTSRRKKMYIAASLKVQSAASGWLARENVTAVISSQKCSSIQHAAVLGDRVAEQNAATLIQRFFRVCLAKNFAIKLRSQRDHQSRLLDEDDDLKRLAQYFASLRFSSKQLEEAAEMQWFEEKTRLAEEVRLENIASNTQDEYVKDAEQNETKNSSTLRMVADAEIDAIMKTVYQRAEAIANEIDLATAAQCVEAYKQKAQYK